MRLTTWRKEIGKEMARWGDSVDKIVSNTLSEDEMDEEFDGGFGRPNGKPFTIWTRTRVYFPAAHDGAEWCVSVSRHPDGWPTHHIE